MGSNIKKSSVYNRGRKNPRYCLWICEKIAYKYKKYLPISIYINARKVNTFCRKTDVFAVLKNKIKNSILVLTNVYAHVIIRKIVTNLGEMK